MPMPAPATCGPPDGTPVLYCGLNAFTSWASAFVGQSISSDSDAGITVDVQSRAVGLRELLIHNGWLQPARLDDDAQAAIAERRGGWACAPTTAMFQAMHTSIDPKVLAGVALNESAFNGRPWPWTLNVAGRASSSARDGRLSGDRTLLAARRSDFDVGLMQINWHYHASRFASPRMHSRPQRTSELLKTFSTRTTARRIRSRRRSSTTTVRTLRRDRHTSRSSRATSPRSKRAYEAHRYLHCYYLCDGRRRAGARSQHRPVRL